MPIDLSLILEMILLHGTVMPKQWIRDLYATGRSRCFAQRRCWRR